MKHIMIVEDSASDSRRLSEILSNAGCAVTFASSGERALDLLKTHKPDMVMMDIHLPELDGFSTARKMGREPHTQDIPVVFLTDRDQKADRVFARMMGARGYITKPYQTDQILAVL